MAVTSPTWVNSVPLAYTCTVICPLDSSSIFSLNVAWVTPWGCSGGSSWLYFSTQLFASVAAPLWPSAIAKEATTSRAKNATRILFIPQPPS